jgi:histidine triad (HIT) family protein
MKHSKEDCIFCRIVAGSVPATRVHEDAAALAFMDLGQVNPGHVLVTTKFHAQDIFELPDEDAGAVFRATARVARAVREAFRPQGVTLLQANGKAALQSVPHFHIHVLPRWEGDGMSLAWPAKNPPREKLEEYAAKIRGSLARG